MGLDRPESNKGIYLPTLTETGRTQLLSETVTASPDASVRSGAESGHSEFRLKDESERQLTAKSGHSAQPV